MDTSELVCLSVDWSNEIKPALRVATAGSAEPAQLLPLEGALRFRILDSDKRYCAGWFDLTGADPRHVNCQNWEQITTGKQCRRCQFKEGFITVHQAHRGLDRLAGNVRSYITQPHRLYLDIFADGSSKVGTVAESRLSSRLSEQGAVAACYVARANDGIGVRKAEAAVSAELRLRQALTGKRKLAAMLSKINVEELRDKLKKLVTQARPLLVQLAAEHSWIEVEEEASWWKPSPSAEAAISSAPVAEYQASLSEGDHSFYIKGMTGSIAVFALRGNDPEPQLFAADLSRLHGMTLTFGDYHSTIESVQTSLF